MFIARKITRAKWNPKQYLAQGEIPADAITIDLRTSGNALSFWRCPTDTTADLEEAALAIAAGRERLDRIEIIWLADSELESDGLTLNDTEGSTPVMGLAKLHVDVSQLDYVRIGRIADRIVGALQDERYRLLKKERVRTLLTLAIQSGRIKPSDLCEDVRTEVTV